MILVDTGDCMGVTLIVDEASVVMLLPMIELQSFIDETLRLVPQGQESLDDQIEELLMEIFE